MIFKAMVKLGIGLLAVTVAIAGCATQGPAANGAAYAAASVDSYSRLGLSPSHIEPWEDGMRTTGGPGSYEWWYFDFTLDDGSTIVVVYYTKNFTSPGSSLQPFVTFQMHRPDGASISRFASSPPAEFSSAKDRCNVRIGANTVTGDLLDYTLHVEAGDVRADLALHRTIPSWRPGTGHMVFQKDGGHFFA
jgi:hypothetical protein